MEKSKFASIKETEQKFTTIDNYTQMEIHHKLNIRILDYIIKLSFKKKKKNLTPFLNLRQTD